RCHVEYAPFHPRLNQSKTRARVRSQVRLKPDTYVFWSVSFDARDRSRIVAKSGSRPMYQKIAEIVKYVLIAKKSQTSGDRKLIQRGPRVFGYGNTQNASHGRPMWMS